MPQDVYIYNPYVPVPKNVRHVEIPKGVTVIGEDAFRDCSDLQSVTIPDSVTAIDSSAFEGCAGLQSITIPDGVKKIDDYAFYKCTGLRSITIPNSVTKIGLEAFYGCAALKSVTIPDSVTKIGNSAFWKCSGLQSVTIPDNVTEIRNNTFRECSALQSVTIPGGVTEIGAYAFASCSGLRSVTIPDSVTEIGHNTFRECSGLQSVTIPDGITKIAGHTFFECSALRSVTIPNGVTEIRHSAFSGCSGLRSVTIPDSVTEIGDYAFRRCNSLQSITIPDNVTEIGNNAFVDCSALQSLMYKDANITPFINIDGYGVNTFNVIRTLIGHRIPLNENTVRRGIDMAHRDRLAQWAADYPAFGEMRLSPAAKSVDGKTEEYLRQLFAAQRKTGCHVPKILNKLAIAVCACGIPPERLAETFDVRYIEAVIRDRVPAIPAEVCRCYYDRGICDMLIRKDKISVMAEAIGLYNRSEHRECYRYLMDFILSHPDTKIEDLQHAADHAEEIPMRAGTTLTQIRRHRTYMENLAEVTKIETKYGKVVPEFRLIDYPCSIAPTGITYNGITARVLDLSDDKDIALAAGLGELTNCCQRLDAAGETAMMHGFLNPDAGFWVIEDKDGKVRAQAEIWKTKNGNLVFDNIEFADTDDEHLAHRIEQLRGVIAAWAMESGYRSIIMGCGYNELGIGSMERAPIPKLRLTPDEVFALQKGNDADVSFRNTHEARRYMRTRKYDPNDFVYTDANEQCVYIKKDGIVSDYLIQGYDGTLTGEYPSSGRDTIKKQGKEIACK